MSTLKEHVEKLFEDYPNSPEVQELKSEILSNLEARAADLSADGMDEHQAVEASKASMMSIEGLGLLPEPPVYNVLEYRMEWLQTALIYTLIAWMITIPLQLFHTEGAFSGLLTAAVVLLGVVYVIFRWAAPRMGARTASLNAPGLWKINRLVWLLWGVYILTMTAYTTLVHMGSQIWFGRSIHISGPYQFGVLASSYAWPCVTILIPLIYHKSLTLKLKHQAGDGDHHEN